MIKKTKNSKTVEIRDSCPVCGMGCIAKLNDKGDIELKFKEWVNKEVYLTREDAEFLRALKKFIRNSIAKKCWA